MTQLVLGLGAAVPDGAHVAGLAQGVRHGLGVLAVVVHQEDLRSDVGGRGHAGPGL
jgi:hypothetical protein